MSVVDQFISDIFKQSHLQGTAIYGLPMHTKRASRVTIYSQQVRALNLIHALDAERALRSEKVVVIGGGIAGVTAATAAAVCGADVTLLERAEEILHMQRGCHSRYLHPGMFDWPQHHFLRAKAHLPLLGWPVGTAHDVAGRIASQFERIRAAVRSRSGPQRGSLDVFTRVIAEVLPSRKGVGWTAIGSGSSGSLPDVRAIILACGFGVERSLPGATASSYWRVDALTQSPLFSRSDKYELAVVGAGDGGITDVVRAKLKNFDHGSFVDGCAHALEPVRDQVVKHESEAQSLRDQLLKEGVGDSEIEQACSDLLAGGYASLPQPDLENLDAAMGEIREGTNLTWITGGPPYSLGSQPLHRVLVWRLLARGKITHVRARVAYVQPHFPQYTVQLDRAPDRIVVDDVLGRVGAALTNDGKTDGEKRFGEIVRQLGELPVEPSFEPLREDVRLHFQRAADELKVSAYDRGHTPGIKLKARFRAQQGGGTPTSKARVFTIDIWLSGCPAHIRWVDYDLHPEYGVITRRAGGAPPFKHWLNSMDDHWIRVRLSDGFETGAWLTQALEDTDGQPADSKAWIGLLRQEAKNMRKAEGYREQSWHPEVDAAEYMRRDGATSTAGPDEPVPS